ICVEPDLKPIKSLRECAPDRVFFDPSYDPVLRELTFRQNATMTSIKAGFTYQVAIFPTDDTGQNGISAFDGAPLKAPVRFRFTTAAAGTNVESLPTGDFYCQIAWTGCAFGDCHQDKTASGGAAA